MCLSMGLHLLPLGVCILMPITFITTYVIAVLLGHVDPDFPYISDTGTNSPESCIFGQFLNIAAVLIGSTVYIRCQQVSEYNRHSNRLLKLNRMSLVIGLFSALGISMVGNFQETNVVIVHLIGAVFAFGLGSIYCWIQTYMSYYMHPHMNSKYICHLRLVICIATSLLFCTTFATDAISKMYFHGNNPRKWYPEDGGFTWHIVSTISEWAMSLFLLMYFATYIGEFKKLTMTAPEITLLISRSRLPTSTDGEYLEPNEVLPEAT